MERLRGAHSYDRVAGYFSPSILEVAGEELESVSGKVRIICNLDLDPDFATAITTWTSPPTSGPRQFWRVRRISP